MKKSKDYTVATVILGLALFSAAMITWITQGYMIPATRTTLEFENLLVNPSFEELWDGNHDCVVFPVGDDPYPIQIGNIFTPEGWTTWFRHEPGIWDQPEVRDAWISIDPVRVHDGEKAELLFTFDRNHDGGFYQVVDVEPGMKLELTAQAHAWSNAPIPGYEDCTDNARCSAGVGEGPVYIALGDAPPLNGDPWNDAVANITFWVGIDPWGGTDPYSADVVWGPGAHIYNAHAQVPAVEVVARSSSVTIFLRSRTMWMFKHNDVYWDSVVLEQTPYTLYLPLVEVQQ